MSTRYGVAIFGLGRAGQFHMTSVLSIPSVELLFVVDPMIENAAATLLKAGAPSTVKVIGTKADVASQVWDNAAVSIVIVAAPTFEHENIIKAGLKHGKHVFSEKPLSFSLQGSQECFDAARHAGKILMTGFQRRFDPSFKQMHDNVRSGAIGDLHIVRSISRDNPMPSLGYLKISHGIFADCVIHDLDMMLWVIKKRPVEVFTHAVSNFKEIEMIGDVDTVTALLKFEVKWTPPLLLITRFKHYYSLQTPINVYSTFCCL
jgi:myo-inositol 2-dehydrogenase/D-chiro-inositol 1-dehydrogenase